jgi:hypothetical protein
VRLHAKLLGGEAKGKDVLYRIEAKLEIKDQERPAFVGELLYWMGEDRLLFASDYALWHPKWLVEKFVDYQYPMENEYPELTDDVKRKILGLNAARLYDLEVPEGVSAGDQGTGPDVTEKPAVPAEASVGGHSE